MTYQLFPNLTADEFDALAADIRERGVMVPVEVDEEGNTLDGHHRVMIADSLGIEYPKVVRDGWSEEQKLTHVIALNAHRRHLTIEQRAEVVTRLRKEGKSLRSIAGALGVDEKTVRNDLSIADLSAMPERIETSDGRSYPASRPSSFRPRLDSIGYYDQPEIDGSAALAPEKWQPAAGLMSSDSAEWYTPRHILDAVVATMGGIDLDPCAEPARSVPAAAHFTEADNGLGRPWAGRVYMNPPYGRVIGAWVDKLADEFDEGNVTEAIALVPARTDTSWFVHLPWTMVALITGRLSFSDHENPAPFPSAACYLGKNDKAFAEAFLSLGIVAVRLEVVA